MANTYLVDGVDLTTYATRIAVAEGLQDTPSPTQGFVDMPMLDGVFDPFGAPGTPRPPEGVATITFDMWLAGVDPNTGTVGAGLTTEREYFRRWDDIVRHFYRRRVTIDHVGPAGIRRAYGRLQSGMKPSRRPSSPWFGRFKATFTIPDGYWADLNVVSTGVQSMGTGGTLSFAAFSGATAPCSDLLVRFYGATVNPKLVTPYGSRLGWNGQIISGRQVQFNTKTGEISSGTGASWTPGYWHEYAPGPHYFEVDPSEPLTATFTHTGGGSASVEVVGRRHYRTSGGGLAAGAAAGETVGYGVGGYGIQPYGL